MLGTSLEIGKPLGSWPKSTIRRVLVFFGFAHYPLILSTCPYQNTSPRTSHISEVKRSKNHHQWNWQLYLSLAMRKILAFRWPFLEAHIFRASRVSFAATPEEDTVPGFQ